MNSIPNVLVSYETVYRPSLKYLVRNGIGGYFGGYAMSTDHIFRNAIAWFLLLLLRKQANGGMRCVCELKILGSCCYYSVAGSTASSPRINILRDFSQAPGMACCLFERISQFGLLIEI